MSIHFNIFISFYRSKLNDIEKAIYDKISDAWLNCHEVVHIKHPVKDFDLSKIIHAIIYDIPELFYIDTSNVEIYCSSCDTKIKTKFLYSYNTISKIKNQIFEMIKEVRIFNDNYQNEKSIINYLINKSEYGYSVDKQNAHSIKGILCDGIGVCEGFAKTFKLLCDALRIPCLVIAGEGYDGKKWTSHAWNIVFVNNQNYHVDLTWSITASNDFGLYLNSSDELFRLDHKWDMSLYPHCNTKNLFEQKLITVNSKNHLDNLLISLKNTNRTSLICQMTWPFNEINEVSAYIKERIHSLFGLNHFSYTLIYYPSNKIMKIDIV